MLALGSGCGENVLVGNWQLRSLDDAGLASADEVSADVDADAGKNPQAEAAQDARDHEAKKNERDKGDKSH